MQTAGRSRPDESVEKGLMRRGEAPVRVQRVNPTTYFWQVFMSEGLSSGRWIGVTLGG